jgi:apolipoprotein N-acyltransferase
MIQPNIRQEDKLVRENQDAILQKMIDLTIKGRRDAQVPPKLIIWPETAITHMVTTESEIIKRIMREAVEDGEYLIFGADRIEPGEPGGPGEPGEPAKWYNSMFIVSRHKVEYVYDKVKLLPFGEYVPFRRFLPKFFLPNGVDCTPGTNAGLIELDGLPPFEAKICSEFMHKDSRSKTCCTKSYSKTKRQIPQVLSEKASRTGMNNKNRRPNQKTSERPLVIQILNNSWFSKSIQSQHQAVDNLRQAEKHVKLLRCSN